MCVVDAVPSSLRACSSVAVVSPVVSIQFGRKCDGKREKKTRPSRRRCEPPCVADICDTTQTIDIHTTFFWSSVISHIS